MVMASAGVNNLPEGPIDSDECRLRRRRLEPRRYVHAASASSSSSAPAPAPAPEEGEAVQPSSSASSEGSGSGSGSEERLQLPQVQVQVQGEASGAAPQLLPPSKANSNSKVQVQWPVAFGSVALAGRLREMEDTVSVRPSLCAWADGSPMHFFAVFDGHGGPHGADAHHPGGGAGRRRGSLQRRRRRRRRPAVGDCCLAWGSLEELRAGRRSGGVGVRVRAWERAVLLLPALWGAQGRHRGVDGRRGAAGPGPPHRRQLRRLPRRAVPCRRRRAALPRPQGQSYPCFLFLPCLGSLARACKCNACRLLVCVCARVQTCNACLGGDACEFC
uniref:protein-serine/threonine phosphatase n=1 Tax=Hordeum vulgare subsp. vulgare TaxID=112509 RepID=F2E197_HORVV|nr:predicted protein [Hordeum vulgare subsp. vulgare]